jgi:hypothetical protein
VIFDGKKPSPFPLREDVSPSNRIDSEILGLRIGPSARLARVEFSFKRAGANREHFAECADCHISKEKPDFFALWNDDLKGVLRCE